MALAISAFQVYEHDIRPCIHTYIMPFVRYFCLLNILIEHGEVRRKFVGENVNEATIQGSVATGIAVDIIVIIFNESTNESIIEGLG